MEIIKKTIIWKTLDIEDKLKVYVVFNELDYLGRVIETIYVSEIPFKFDPNEFLKYTIDNGSIKGFKKPFTKYFNDLMAEYFDIYEHNEVWRPVRVETEAVCNTAKFVFYKHKHGHQIMEWEDLNND